MSVECGECEMDARSYHAPGCSRYKPERAISRYLVDEELVHPAEVEEVERQVLRVLAEERDRLREKVEELVGFWDNHPSKRLDGPERRLVNEIFGEVLALLAEPVEERN